MLFSTLNGKSKKLNATWIVEPNQIMSLEIVKGNIFTTECSVIVNTINCVGVMGAGLALECRLRYPDMYARYIELCKHKKIDIGFLWLYQSSSPWILNFPTKKNWKNPSSVTYLRAGLEKFCDTYQVKKIESIAFPLLGADKGGIAPEESLKVMMQYLDGLNIRVEVYLHDAKANDDVFNHVKERVLVGDVQNISEITGIKMQHIKKVIEGFEREDVYQLNQLAQIKGIGIKTLEKLYQIAMQELPESTQQRLF